MSSSILANNEVLDRGLIKIEPTIPSPGSNLDLVQFLAEGWLVGHWLEAAHIFLFGFLSIFECLN